MRKVYDGGKYGKNGQVSCWRRGVRRNQGGSMEAEIILTMHELRSLMENTAPDTGDRVKISVA